MPSKVKEKKIEIVNGVVIKYHANGKTVWSKGKTINGVPSGYWEWFRIDGTLKRSGSFKDGKQTGAWTTYDKDGKKYKVTNK